MLTDVRGLEVTADNEAAVGHLDDTITHYAGFKLDTGAHLKQALTADPDMAMGLIVRGYFMKLFAMPALEVKARQSLEKAEASIESRGGSERERRHARALRAWCDGDERLATAVWEELLLHDPLDLMALKLAHYTHFYFGDSRNMRDSVARTSWAWTPDTPGYGFVQGMYAFGLEEAGNYADAEAAGRRAVEINPADVWAAHAVAHVMEMQGRHREGIAWIDGLADNWNDVHNFVFHVWWHKCLYHLELGQYDAVLALYDNKVRAESTDDLLDISNGAAMLWRLEDAGIDVGDRWTELADRAATHVDDHLLFFADAHYFLALAAAGRDDEAAAMLASLKAAADQAGTDQEQVIADVGVPLCEGIAALRRADYGRACDLLLPLRYRLDPVGGSHAQRDLFQQMLIQAALRGGRLELARTLLAERTALKPNSPPAWRNYAAALDGLGDAAGAANARDRADSLLAA